MDSGFVERLEAEEAELTKKLEAVRLAIKVYRGGVGSAPVPAVSDSTPRKVRRSPGSRQTEYARRIRDVAREMIDAADDDPVPTRDIHRALEARGIEVRGRDPISALSALLSRTGEFENRNRQGWVAQPKQETGPDFSEPVIGGVAERLNAVDSKSTGGKSYQASTPEGSNPSASTHPHRSWSSSTSPMAMSPTPKRPWEA